mmetsp:Transcript_16726/g.23480  ORF Transcript_16726/g.23480 Transcript_16726/m.23480 type:complete len:286 (-) Transcript_16726:172-1029(-)
MLLADCRIEGFHGNPARELHLHDALAHTHLFFVVILLLHFLLPGVELRGIMQVLLIALEGLVLLGLLLLHQGVLSKHRRHVVPDRGIFGNGDGFLLCFWEERAFRHALTFHLFLQVVESSFVVTTTRCFQIEMISFVVLGEHLRLLFLQLFLLLLFDLVEAVLVDRGGNWLSLDLAADHVWFRDQSGPWLRELEGFELSQLLLTLRNQGSAICCLHSAGRPKLHLVTRRLELLLEALQLADDVLLDVVDIIELAPLYLDPFLELLDTQGILHQGIDRWRSTITAK